MSKKLIKTLRRIAFTSLITAGLLAGCGTTSKADSAKTNHSSSSTATTLSSTTSASATKETTASSQPATTSTTDKFLSLTYNGTQTVEINNNRPTFTKDELSLKDGAWEKYGELDRLNRVTTAEAMLNMSIQPTGERGDISSVTPTGWKNKKLKSGYLYNRSHLIGYALAGENANVKNLMTGTAQLNNPEMLRHEMDIKAYIEQSPKNYVRYLVEPIFKDDELVARGGHMMAQAVNSSALAFNVYIFNIQDGVTINYADGSSQITSSNTATATKTTTSTAITTPASTPTPTPTAGKETQYVDANGNGLIKGSKNKIYHLPGSKYYDRTTNPAAMFKTVSEAVAAGYRAPKQ